MNRQQSTRNNSGSWTTSELGRLRRLAGRPVAEIAAALDRTPGQVRAAAYRNAISLRRPGSRRGLVMGQPRGQSWKDVRLLGAQIATLHDLREQILRGEVDVHALELAARRRTALARGAPVCPACGERPQEIRRTGFCLPCHHRELARAHRADEARRAARREYDREKQRAHRRRPADPDAHRRRVEASPDGG